MLNTKAYIAMQEVLDGLINDVIGALVIRGVPTVLDQSPYSQQDTRALDMYASKCNFMLKY